MRECDSSQQRWRSDPLSCAWPPLSDSPEPPSSTDSPLLVSFTQTHIRPTCFVFKFLFPKFLNFCWIFHSSSEFDRSKADPELRSLARFQVTNVAFLFSFFGSSAHARTYFGLRTIGSASFLSLDLSCPARCFGGCSFFLTLNVASQASSMDRIMSSLTGVVSCVVYFRGI